MKKILLSLMTVALVAGVAVGATRAYFSDTELSEDNQFQAGSLDLKVDYDWYYNVSVEEANEPGWQPEPWQGRGGWELTDLNQGQKFFDFDDLKPGDYGEGTISLHVDNNAWLRVVIDELHNEENLCTEPESEVEDSCAGFGAGELAQNLYFQAWLDWGETPEWDGDPGEGDNIWQPGEPELMTYGPASDIIPNGVTWDLGPMEASNVYYIGVRWEVPSSVGNEIQSDSLDADIRFEVVQERHNPTPIWP